MNGLKQKVLILGVAAVQMDAILELKSMGYETHACAMAKDGPGADAADYFCEINIIDVESLTNYVHNNQISLVYSVGSDIAMPIACRISEQLNLPHFVTEKTAFICNNKHLMRTTLGKDFFGNVKFQVVEKADEKLELEFPFILKPADSQGQRGVTLIHSYDEYIRYFSSAKKFSKSGYVILEEYLSGPELSVNGYLVDGELKYMMESDRVTWPNFTGLIHKHVVPAEQVDHEISQKLRSVFESACNKLGIHNGPVYAQMKVEQGTPYIIEITPRLDGCHMWKILNLCSGVNLLKLTFEHLLNHRTTELDKQNNSNVSSYVLEFICQEPDTPSNYSVVEEKMAQSIDSFQYYPSGANVRPINGRFEKIGYCIYQG